MISPISRIASLTVGTVESVAPDEIVVLLDIDSPRSTALNTGVPTPFPRINSFVLLPNEYGAVVGIVIWLGVERSAYPKRQGLKDFGLIDLPFPLRKMIVSPIGTIFNHNGDWHLEKGVQGFPSIGDSVILPTREQIVAIITGRDKDGRVSLGTCPVAHDATVTIDPDKLFGRHLAILGNTGSGKSCTVAGLIRSTIKSAISAIQNNKEEGAGNTGPEHSEEEHVNARFIILDPNGEYSSCFQDLGTTCRVFQVPSYTSSSAPAFHLPAWMWNSSEWAAVAQAAPKVQRPLLQTALRDLKSGSTGILDIQTRIRGRCRITQVYLSQFNGKGTQGWPERDNCGSLLQTLNIDLESYIQQLDGSHALIPSLSDLYDCTTEIIGVHAVKSRPGSYVDFADTTLTRIAKHIEEVLSQFTDNSSSGDSHEDSPVLFDLEELTNYLEVLSSTNGNNAGAFIATMVLRIKAMLNDARMKDVICPTSEITLTDWLKDHIGDDGGANGPIVIIDLSLVPYEILHLVIAIASRLILESLQRYRKIQHKNLPTVLVLEEAHTFIGKRLPHGDEIPSPADMCRESFERIAREGRKFGLGLVLSSQRPSELSETVLSQCNSFLLHRITNHRDQDLLSKLVPDNSRGLLRELPSLPTKHCILLGVASKIPTLLEIEHLNENQRPKSDDPDFWKVWTNQEVRSINWGDIVNEWTGQSDISTPPQAAI